MSRTISLILVVCFIFWLIPLGAFIKPSQEQLACNGRRAICLCTKLLTKDGKPAKLKVFVNVSPLKESSSSGGASHHYVALDTKNFSSAIQVSLIENLSVSQSSDYLRSIDHVPKA